MSHKINVYDSGFTLDDLIQEEININNFIKGKTNPSNFNSLNNFFSKSFSLKHADKNIFWDRTNLQNNTYDINILDILPPFQISNKLMNSLYDFIFNSIKELFIGKINTTKTNNNYYDIIDCQSTKYNDSNLLMTNNNFCNNKNNFKELIEIAYNKLNTYERNNFYYHNIFHFYKKNENCLKADIYTIFPNVNFVFRQIKNLSFSNTNLNKILINNLSNLNENESGFFTMSQNHRLIALKENNYKEIIFGIWINLKNENPSSKKIDLDFVFNKYKTLIYLKCLKFIQLSEKIESIYSPSPEQNIFILVLFYKGMQCHYEVTMYPNKIDNFKKNNLLSKFNSEWLISKNEYELDEQALKVPFDFDLRIEINNSNIKSMTDYCNNELNLNNNNINDNINNTHKENKNIINLSNDFDGFVNENKYEEYNYPLTLPVNKNDNNKKNINKNELISHASTNSHSNKPSLSLSKNSIGKNNNANSNNSEIFDDSNNLLNNYVSDIMKNSESIKNLQNQVNRIETNIMEILHQLENKKEKKKKKTKNEKNKQKKEEKLKNENNGNKNREEMKMNVSNINDVSVNVPHIIYTELPSNMDD